MPESGPTAWVDGRVYTGSRRVEALLIDAGRVVVAGSSESVRRERPTGATTRSLEGRALIPGLVDSHCHLQSSVLRLHQIDLAPSTSVSDVVARLRSGAARTPIGPIVGWGWDESNFAARRYPGRLELDRVSEERPVVAYRRCLHVASVNSAALESLGIAPNDADPPGGRFGREHGDLDGRLYDGALARLHRLEAERFEVLDAELRAWLRGAAACGLTTLVGMSARLSELRRVQAVQRPGSPELRIRAYVRPDQLPAGSTAAPLPPSDDLRVTGVKVFADGALGARTAWLGRPYDDEPAGSGSATAPLGDLVRIVREAGQRRLSVAVHAIGDRAIAEALAAFRTEPPFGIPRIEHASLTPPTLLAEIRTVRPAVVVQPSFVTSDRWLVARLGADRARWTYAFRSLLDLGVTVAGSSDSPVESRDPWVGLAAATSVRSKGSEREQLSAEGALRMYTTAAGEALGEVEIGSLEPGSFADLALLDASDWETALPAGAAGVRATYVNGASTFERDVPLVRR